MVVGNISKIKNRSGKNRNTVFIVSEVTYADIDNPGHVLGWQQKHFVITGDCVALDHKTNGVAYYFNVYVKQGNNYVLDKKQSLYVDYSINPFGDMIYYIDVTKTEYTNLSCQLRAEDRKRKISGILE